MPTPIYSTALQTTPKQLCLNIFHYIVTGCNPCSFYSSVLRNTIHSTNPPSLQPFLLPHNLSRLVLPLPSDKVNPVAHLIHFVISYWGPIQQKQRIHLYWIRKYRSPFCCTKFAAFDSRFYESHRRIVNSYKETLSNFATHRANRKCCKTKAIMGANILPVLSPFLPQYLDNFTPLTVDGCLIKACFHYFVGVFSTLSLKGYRQKRRGFMGKAKKNRILGYL